MLAVESFDASSTNVQLSCPEDVTGLERIMIAAQGNLQRLLSTFFQRPIQIETIYAHAPPRTHTASLETPIRQERQVYLNCSGRTCCIATSSVTITTPECERLFLDEKYPIGQMFRKLGRAPQFSLLNVESGQAAGGKRELRRTYKLETEGICCEILEEFPDRDMFVLGEKWFDAPAGSQSTEVEEETEEGFTEKFDGLKPLVTVS